MEYWEAYGFKTATQFWVVIIGGVTVGLTIVSAYQAYRDRRRGHYTGWDFLDFVSLIGSIFKWIFKGLGFLIVFIFALSRKEAPPSSGTHEQEENLDDFEDVEDKTRRPRKIDEYHV